MFKGKSRALIYFGLVIGAALAVWQLSPTESPKKDSREKRVRQSSRQLSPSRSASRPRRSLTLPRLPNGTVNPDLLTVVQGRVVDADSGRGISGVRVRFGSAAGAVNVVTQGDGEYRLELPGADYEVSLLAEEHAGRRETAKVQIESGSPVRWLDFSLQRLSSVAGRVVDAAGKPVEGASVRQLWPEDAAGLEPRPHRAVSDRNGRFTVKVAPGRASLRVDGGRRGTAVSSALEVAPVQHLSGVVVQLGVGHTLSGRIVGPAKERVSGGYVLLADALGTRRLPAGNDGTFAAGGLPPGTKRLQAVAVGFGPSHVTRVSLQDGRAAKVIVRLSPDKRVAGQVVDAEGAPVTGASVTVRPGGPGAYVDHLADLQRLITGKEGQFAFGQMPNAPLVVTARASGSRYASRAGVAPGAGNVRLALESTGTVLGVVTDGDRGKPLRDFRVEVLSASGTGNPYGPRPALRVVTATGAFRVDGLPAGTYRLAFRADGFGGVSKEGVAVMAGNNTRLDVVLYEGGRVAGRVKARGGVGVPGASVELDSGWFGKAVLTGPGGEFELRGVARGRRNLTIWHPDALKRQTVEVSVFPGQTANVALSLGTLKHALGKSRHSGIGLALGKRPEGLTVTEVRPGSPADVAGIQTGDRVLKIDGAAPFSTRRRGAEEILRGATGTAVQLNLQRGSRTFELAVVRGQGAVPGETP